jgi:hypothetical protein
MRAPLQAAVLGVLAVAFGGAPTRAFSETASEARTPGEVYERKTKVSDCLAYVAKDLRTRYDAAPELGAATLLLVVDPTASLKDEIGALRVGLPEALTAGPKGMRVGVLGVGADYTPPSVIPGHASGALEALEYLPVNGPKNLHAAVRDGVRHLAREGAGPRAILLVTQEGGDAEDDVEATRDDLLQSTVAFYALASEAAFERPWRYTLEPDPASTSPLPERFTPEPAKREKTLFVGGDVAFGLVPYRWELDLAQTEFLWVRPPNYPVPSGFGYWGLATLAHTSGGRYFVYDFDAPALSEARNERRKLLYDYSRLNLLAPDLRSRSRILKDLSKDVRATAIVRAWELLADEAVPVLRDLGTLERAGTSLAVRAARPVRSTAFFRDGYEDVDEVQKALESVRLRADAVDKALDVWSSANAKERPQPPGADPLSERVEADFQLLGVQLRKVRFHLGEAEAALASIKPLDVSYRRARIVPVPLMGGVTLPPKGVDLKDEERNARFAAMLAAAQRVATKYAGTPWSLVLEKGWMITFAKNVEILEPEEPDRPTKPPKEPREGGKKDPAPPRPSAPPPPPPPGPRPGSGTGGPTTGG